MTDEAYIAKNHKADKSIAYLYSMTSQFLHTCPVTRISNENQRVKRKY